MSVLKQKEMDVHLISSLSEDEIFLCLPFPAQPCIFPACLFFNLQEEEEEKSVADLHLVWKLVLCKKTNHFLVV